VYGLRAVTYKDGVCGYYKHGTTFEVETTNGVHEDNFDNDIRNVKQGKVKSKLNVC
jgi:hypothetical protein